MSARRLKRQDTNEGNFQMVTNIDTRDETAPTLHPALAVELNGWKKTEEHGFCGGAGYVDAMGFGVYIRNPLAFHVQDFMCIDDERDERFKLPDNFDDRATAYADAWRYADALADHLGCTVQSFLARPVAPVEPVVPAAPIDSTTLCEVAACLWEAALDFRARNPGDGADNGIGDAARAFIEENGFSSARLLVIAHAEPCERAWLALSEDERAAVGSFDWEFCPRWLAKRMDWGAAPVEPVERAACQSCDWTGPVADLAMIDDVFSRVAAGEVMPAGECPDCHALAHVVEPGK